VVERAADLLQLLTGLILDNSPQQSLNSEPVLARVD
jgi:hypothetical protein